ncbi:unnamed protein product [Eruca vesicaria subsp. sativa]|uniref:U-box domain-containing protein n=1 Tax=Eruca vesicaria subsp. sativa TaxID=29727 RepID=A0ABC8K0P5_ERUVS|nr:unnamed protein product [Eruca vesicaria subsp. sativa]
MRDPVVLASGQTYDKLFIQKWLSSGNRTCPKTQQVLSHTSLTPNLLISDMISKWSKTVGVEKLNQCSSSARTYVMKVALGHSASNEIRNAIFKASKVVYDAS